MSAGTRPTMTRLCEVQKYIVDCGHVTLGELAEHFGVSERTVKRDVRALNAAPMNAQIKYHAKDGGYRCANPASITTLPLSGEELQALVLLRALGESLGQSPIGHSVRGALLKIQAVLPDSLQAFVDRDYQGIACFIDPPPNEPPETNRHLRPLLLAIERRQRVIFSYTSMHSRGEITERLVDPYLLFFRRERWYLRAYCHLRQERRDFALGRMAELRVEPSCEAFTTPPKDELLAELGKRFGDIEGEPYTVKIKFDAEWAPHITERKWHATQEIEPCPDGSCTLTMTVEGLSTVAGWVMSFRGHATPLAPPELVSEVRSAARNLFTAHK